MIDVVLIVSVVILLESTFLDDLRVVQNLLGGSTTLWRVLLHLPCSVVSVWTLQFEQSTDGIANWAKDVAETSEGFVNLWIPDLVHFEQFGLVLNKAPFI